MISQAQLIAWKDFSFQRICAEIMHLFTDIEVDLLLEMSDRAFCKFNPGGEVPLPITPLGNLLLLDTSLGPTLSFKDIGQQMVAQLLNYYLGRRGRKACIVVETSGDTGPAAIYGVKDCPHAEIFCLYPNNRVSPIQELQMITVQSDNVHVYRTDGTTDDQVN
jgi:threonine synthase